MSTLWDDVALIRQQSPLVHNITNYVVMNATANALLALGASPVMAHAIEEVEEMASIGRALVLNIGTLSMPWVEAMFAAGRTAKRRGIPVVLDPVGAGATAMRTQTALRMMDELAPTIVRGNASEILALAGVDEATKGVDSTHSSEDAFDAAQTLSGRYGCVVSVSGERDLVIENRRVARIDNGHPMMTKVTGSGCIATALTGAFAAVNPSPFEAAAHAMMLSGIAGELAAASAEGPGSYQVRFLDLLHGLSGEQLRDAVRMA
ncbi:MAG TPA: hydroxyethylthiazole kinase [Polyangiaceae bacterium]|nr:hydroxyethylthiazole kinase [Polyangiaceae bacterium]